MGKELEALNKIQHDFGQLKGQELVSCYETIFNALKRLESIDNANPSEALECVENIDADLAGLPKHITEYDDGFDSYLEDIWDNIDTIKNYILKEQEPKCYLKWEDLEFKIENFPIKVKVGNTEYLLCFHNIGKDQALTIQNYDQLLCTFYLNSYYDKQFFNDLHLERVEE